MLEFNVQKKDIEIGSLLNAIRKKQNRKLIVIATEAGISKGYLSAIESSTKIPSFSILKKICEALKINVHKLLYKAHKNAGIDEQCIMNNFSEMERELKELRTVLYPKDSYTVNIPTSARQKLVEVDGS